MLLLLLLLLLLCHKLLIGFKRRLWSLQINKQTASKHPELLINPISIKKLTVTVKPELTTTSVQRPLVYNGQSITIFRSHLELLKKYKWPPKTTTTWVPWMVVVHKFDCCCLKPLNGVQNFNLDRYITHFQNHN